MARTVYEELASRGMVAQSTAADKIPGLLAGDEKLSFYIGFDPTADSLHVGHFIQLMVMAHMQRAGHRPIVLLGGATGRIGDPSGKSDMRKMMTVDIIEHNIACFKEQMSRFIDFSDGRALMVNNADWLLELNYVEFLREVGVHFSVNRMLTAECFKSRMEKGLSFMEFNYMLMQAYDFYYLNREYGCTLEFGGDDQWSNIIAGVELCRRKEGKEVYGMTFSLLTNSEGTKMGKTEKGAVWLDAEKTSPYEFFQYWRNVADADVIRCMNLLTFVPVEEIAEYAKLEGSELNSAKERLAFEVTALVHGKDEAQKNLDAAKAVFGTGVSDENMPSTDITEIEFGEGMGIIDILVKTGLAQSKGEARRLVEQGGISINNDKISSIDFMVIKEMFDGGFTVVKKGKKVFHRINLI